MGLFSRRKKRGSRAERRAKLQQTMASNPSLGGIMGGIAGIGQAAVGTGSAGGGDISQSLSDINSKLDTLTGGGAGGANNTIQTPGGDLSDPMQSQEDMLGADTDMIDGSALAKIRKYKGSCKMKRNN